MATTRPKDISKTASTVASDDFHTLDGATNGTRKISRNNLRTDLADAFENDPTTYKLAPLNVSNKIDSTYLPASGDTPKGDWDADNTTLGTLNDGTGSAGDYYDITDANGGTLDQGAGTLAINGATVAVGDRIKYDGANWFIIPQVSNILDGTSTAAGGRSALSVNSIDEDAQANATKLVGPSLWLRSADFISVSDSAKLSQTDGTDDLPFSVLASLNSKDVTSSVIVGKFGAGAATREWRLYFDGSDLLTFAVTDTSGNFEGVYATAALTSYEGEFIHVAATYGGSGPNSASAFTAAADEMAIYVNGSAVATTESSSGTYLGMSDTSEPLDIGRRNGADYFDGHINRVQIVNRELTAAEVAKVARGIDLGFADEWGDHTANIYSGDSTNFASSLGNWTEYGATSVTVAQSGGVAQITNTAASSGARGLKNSVDTLTEGKRYRMEFTCAASSGTGQEVRIRNFNNGSFDSPANAIGGSIDGSNFFVFTPTGSTVKYSFEFIAQPSASDYLIFDLANNTGAGEVYDIDDVKVYPIGVLADFKAENFIADKLIDLSSNNFVGTNNGATLVGGRKALQLDTDGASAGNTILSIYDGSSHLAYLTDKGDLNANSISSGASSELTIATGAVTATKSYHTIDTESDAASDDLDTISGGRAGQILVVQANNSARSVVLKDGTGNLKLSGDITLDNAEDTAVLVSDGTSWYELSNSNNGA